MTESEQVIKDLLADVRQYAAAHKGKIYAPISHPAFADIPYHHGPERFELIAPHIPQDAQTALDVGAHWGYFAHRLEDAGLRVTAAEINKNYLTYLNRIRDVCGKKFVIYDKSIFEMRGPISFDVLLALNIFHHFIKAESVFNTFVEFLGRLECKVIFFQAHNPMEGQMSNSYRNFEPEEFAEFVRKSAHMNTVQHLGTIGKRPMYAIT